MRKGEVKVNLSRAQMVRALQWLDLAAKHEPGVGTILGGPEPDLRPALRSLSRRIEKSARGKRASGGGRIGINLPRIEVEAFVQSGWIGAWHLKPRNVEEAFLMSLGGKRGRRRVTGSALKERLSPDYTMIEDRQRWRLKARAREEAKWQAYKEELDRRGETILTSSIKYGEI
ncbi:hypothetical protein [Pseudooceanicola nitratireducens]|uniref:hypothetical protein n=1 Tax=Pseudooceanicola nitratireducens TaxID=517719 RepID=UPI001C93F60D|nr:hypothetical protein [Pseudooceanicola nitratireducens]MBY6155800.1 hypothetical protein [Pseudooceanicola nitratireducens]